MTKADQTLDEAVTAAIRLVNTQPGLTCVHLRFAEDPYEVDFVANSARTGNGRFEFQAGFETYEGRIEELSEVRTSSSLTDAAGLWSPDSSEASFDHASRWSNDALLFC